MTINQYKRKWMIDNGFKRELCPYRNIVYNYKGYSWTVKDIENTSMSVIMKYKLFYDGEITEEELDKYIKFEKTFKKKGLRATQVLLDEFINKTQKKGLK